MFAWKKYLLPNPFDCWSFDTNIHNMYTDGKSQDKNTNPRWFSESSYNLNWGDSLDWSWNESDAIFIRWRHLNSIFAWVIALASSEMGQDIWVKSTKQQQENIVITLMIYLSIYLSRYIRRFFFYIHFHIFLRTNIWKIICAQSQTWNTHTYLYMHIHIICTYK